MKRIYFQTFGGVMFGEFVLSAYLGFQHRPHFDPNIQLKFYEDINEVPVNPEFMVVGCVEDTITYFNKLGIKYPVAMNVPVVLRSMINRKIGVMSLENFFETNVCPVFVKPVELKACESGLIAKDSAKRFVLSDAAPGTMLMTSEPMNIINEYRVFVNRHKILGVRQYNSIKDQSHFFYIPSELYVTECIELMRRERDTPISYTLDVAITATGSTELIECNDGWSVGSYGLEGEPYVQFLKDRWYELKKQSGL